ncbi:DNA-protecting protein DprA [Gracilibacillus oryzae]|uniref:DNA-protecting protein DprA n=1 Tax=Gracilibacillus oryzae TaxID=1672701 RepID=A0A7C8GW98_9BACI|nr:DNA-processing protein DprA [Gracilibacillus oryzae]KAB8138725.1 DNA-protecting protein DprA [Gracilibacillus oryzae]
MEQISWRLVHLQQIDSISRKLLWKVLHKDPELNSVYQWTNDDWMLSFDIKLERAQMIKSMLADKELQRKIVKQASKYKIVTIFDPEYPEQLRNIPDPPFVLYMVGNSSLLSHTPNISVVGTRYPSEHAKTVMNRLLSPILKDNWLIVSGMAVGVDGFAHELALANNAPTIAVLGSGFEHIYPRRHLPLFKEIIRHGLVISEYPPHITPQKFHFPERNRIISGLTFGTLVVEAKTKSGSLITVDQALEQGKEVFAVPGSILSKTSEGCHQLIQDGARLVQTSEDITKEWHDRG